MLAFPRRRLPAGLSALQVGAPDELTSRTDRSQCPAIAGATVLTDLLDAGTFTGARGEHDREGHPRANHARSI